MAVNKKIAGLIVEIGGDTTKLGRALQDIDAKSKDLSGELRSINKLLELNPGNADLLAQKQKVLAEAVANTGEKLRILREAEEEATAAFERGEASEEQIRALQREIISTETALSGYEKAAEETAQALSGLGDNAEGAGQSQDELGKATELSAEELEKQKQEAAAARDALGELAQEGAAKAIKTLGALTAAVGATFTALTKLISESASAADELGDMSKVTGLSVETLQKYKYAADMAGTSLETITGAEAKLVQNMSSAASGTGTAAEAFKALGVEVKDSAGHLRSTDEVFSEVLGKLGEIENETERDAAAMKIFGKSAQELNPLILEGAGALERYGAEAEELGIIVSEEAVGALGDMQAEVKKTNAQLDAIKTNASAKFAPAITKMLQGFQKLLTEVNKKIDTPRVRKAIDQLSDAFVKLLDKGINKAVDILPKLADAVTWLVEHFKTLAIVLGSVWGVFKTVSVITNAAKAFTVLKDGLIALKTSIGAATVAQQGLNTAMAAGAVAGGWITAIVAVIAAGALLIKKQIDKTKEHYADLISTSTELRDNLKSVADDISAAQESYNTSISESSASADIADKYLQRLEQLESQTSLTADEQKEYNSLVTKLKTVMPSLNTALNKETGLLQEGATALRKQVEKWKEKVKLEATEELLKEQLKAQVQLQQTLVKAQDDYTSKSRDLEEFAAIYEKIYKNEQITADEAQRFSDIAKNYDVSNLEEMKKVAGASKVAFEEASDAVNKNEKEVDELVGVYEDLAKETGLISEAVDEGAEKLTKMGEAADRSGAYFDKLRTEHMEKLADAAHNVFDKVKTDSDLTIQEMIETLRFNRQAIEDWDENLKKLYERGGLELAAYWEAQGTKAAGEVAEIARATDEAFDEFLFEWNENGKDVGDLGSHYASMLVQGVINRVDSEIYNLKNAGRRAAKALSDAFANYLEIKSPSRRFDRFAGNTMLGFVRRWRKDMGKLTDAGADAAEAFSSAFSPALDGSFATGGLMRRLYAGLPVQPGTPATLGDDLTEQLSQILAAIREGKELLLDGDLLVGATVDRYDKALGSRLVTATRGA